MGALAAQVANADTPSIRCCGHASFWDGDLREDGFSATHAVCANDAYLRKKTEHQKRNVFVINHSVCGGTRTNAKGLQPWPEMPAPRMHGLRPLLGWPATEDCA